MTFTIFPEHAHKIIIYYVILGIFSVFMKLLKSVTTAYTPELYPTSIRTTALGVMNGLDRSASILMPMIFSELVYTSFRLAMGGFGACYLIGFLVSLTLDQENKNKPLSESLLSDKSDNDLGTSGMKHSLPGDT